MNKTYHYLQHKKLIISLLGAAVVATVAVIGFYFYAHSYLPPTQSEAEAYLKSVRSSINLLNPGTAVYDKVHDSGCGKNQTSWLPLQTVCIESMRLYFKGVESSSRQYDYKNAAANLKTLDKTVVGIGWIHENVVSGNTTQIDDYAQELAAQKTSALPYLGDTPYSADNKSTLYLYYFKANDPLYAGKQVSDFIPIDVKIDLQPGEYIYGVSLGIAYRQHWWGR